jgi:hypothetical protein
MIKTKIRRFFIWFLGSKPGRVFFLRLANSLFCLPLYLDNKKNSRFYIEWMLKGIASAKVIPYRLSRIWPFWVYKQLSPKSDGSFVNCSSFSMMNVTNRNWVNLSLPGVDERAYVDPRGLIMPFNDSWSLDFWLADASRVVTPASLKQVQQTLTDGKPCVKTEFYLDKLGVSSEIFYHVDDENKGTLFNRVVLENKVDEEVTFSFYFAVRPYNLEGLAPIDEIVYLTSNAFVVDDRLSVVFDQIPDNVVCINYDEGDVSEHFKDWEMILKTKCDKHLASAFVEYRIVLEPGQKKVFSAKMPAENCSKLRRYYEKTLSLTGAKKLMNRVCYYKTFNFREQRGKFDSLWGNILDKIGSVELPNDGMQKIFNDSKAHVLSFINAKGVYVGDNCNNEYWVREMVSMIMALNRVGAFELAGACIECLPLFRNGFFSKRAYKKCDQSDQLGQHIFVLFDYYQLSRNSAVLEKYFSRVEFLLGAIERGRVKHSRHKELIGLLKKSSAFDDTGIRDHYVWDNLWALAGVRSAIKMAELLEKKNLVLQWSRLEAEYMQTINQFILYVAKNEGINLMIPVSKNRLMDSAIIGSLISVYPLDIYDAGDEKVQGTINIIEKKYMYDDLYYNYIGHVGLGVSQNFLLAQVYRAQKNKKAFKVFDRIINSVSGVGTWPESMHPKSYGGCVGSGHYGPANAEYICFVRNLIINDDKDNELELLPFIPAEWLKQKSCIISIKNMPSKFGCVSFTCKRKDNSYVFEIDAKYIIKPKKVRICFPLLIKFKEIDAKKEAVNDDFIEISADNRNVILTVE